MKLETIKVDTETLKEVKALKPMTKFKAIEISSGETVRAEKESEDNIFVFAKGKSRYGYRYMTDSFCTFYKIVPEKDPEIVWKRKIENIIKRLERSGLWPEILEKFKTLRNVSYKERDVIDYIWRNQPYKADRTEEEFREAYGYLYDKYPFILRGGVDYFYLKDGMSDCKTKSMYFGHRNTQVKERIKDAMLNKRKCSEFARTSYDVSFEYDPEKKKAWYSEEYKDCGNGHYYLALDESMALFCEDD